MLPSFDLVVLRTDPYEEIVHVSKESFPNT